MRSDILQSTDALLSRFPKTHLPGGSQTACLFSILLVSVLFNLSGKHSLLVLSSLFNFGSILALLIGINRGLYTSTGKRKLLSEVELPTFSLDAVLLKMISTAARLIPLIFSSRFRIPGALFLGLADALTAGVCGAVWLRRQEFPMTEPSAFYCALAGCVFMFSFPFRAALAHDFVLDSLWTWSACLEPLAVVPECVAVLMAIREHGRVANLLTYPFPPVAAMARLISAVTAAVYWTYATSARRGDYRLISGLLLLIQGVGVAGALLVATLSLRAEIQKRKVDGEPLLTKTEAASVAKAL